MHAAIDYNKIKAVRDYTYFNHQLILCECWTITSDIEKKIEAAEMRFIRRMLRISGTEKKPNVNVLREENI